MPASEFSGAVLTNVGPLTTTFSASPSCASAKPQYGVVDDWLDDGQLNFLRTTCGPYTRTAGCAPSASKLNQIDTEALETPKLQGLVPYFSPGLSCPAGWTSAVVASSASHAVSATGLSDDYESISGLFLTDILLGALEEDETLVWCCPRYILDVCFTYLPTLRLTMVRSDYSILDNSPLCVSTVGPFTTGGPFTTYCELWLYAEDPQPVTSFAAQSMLPAIVTTHNIERFYSSNTTRYHVADATPAVVMYYRDSDKGSENESGKENNDRESDQRTGGEDDNSKHLDQGKETGQDEDGDQDGDGDKDGMGDNNGNGGKDEDGGKEGNEAQNKDQEHKPEEGDSARGVPSLSTVLAGLLGGFGILSLW